MLMRKRVISIVLLLFFLFVQPVLAQSDSQNSLNGAISNITGYLLLQDESDSLDPEPSGDVNANLESLTRVNGVSPETVYFSAQGSTCSDCTDIFGLNTPTADAYSELAYHFDFDDSDSGNFATTGNSRNKQVSGSPRAIHTFECKGSTDPNWNATEQLCIFDVGVRVQAKDSDYDDAFVQIRIQPLYGSGGYYANTDITCVSSTSDFSWCPHSDGARLLSDIPGIGNWDGQLVLVDNDGGDYSSVCMGADEQNGAAISMSFIEGAGTKPEIGFARLSSRPGNCNASFSTDTNIAMLADNHPERNAQGELIDGYGFNQKVVGFRIGTVQNGSTANFIQYHDVDMDWTSDASATGEFTVVNNSYGCRNNDDLTCSNIPYPSYIFLTDSIIGSNINNLSSPTNIGCFGGCMVVNMGIAGVEINRAVEHNIRFQGAWGLVLANNWVRGNHSGGKGGKSRITIRSVDSGAAHSLTKNPEDLSGSDYLRGTANANDPYNFYNVMVDNRINQQLADIDSEHNSAAWVNVMGNFGGEFGTTYISGGSTDGNPQQSLQTGRYKAIRQINFADSATAPDCGLGPGYYSDNTVYNDSSDVYFEDTPSCNTVNNFNYNTAPLSYPLAPGT